MSVKTFNHISQQTIMNARPGKMVTLLIVPKVRLQYAMRGFLSMGVKIFNSLPANVRKVDTKAEFKKLCDSFF